MIGREFHQIVRTGFRLIKAAGRYQGADHRLEAVPMTGIPVECGPSFLDQLLEFSEFSRDMGTQAGKGEVIPKGDRPVDRGESFHEPILKEACVSQFMVDAGIVGIRSSCMPAGRNRRPCIFPFHEGMHPLHMVGHCTALSHQDFLSLCQALVVTGIEEFLRLLVQRIHEGAIRKGRPDGLPDVQMVGVDCGFMVSDYSCAPDRFPDGEPLTRELEEQAEVPGPVTATQGRISGSESSQNVLRAERMRPTKPAASRAPICLAAVWPDIRQGAAISLMVIGLALRRRCSTILRCADGSCGILSRWYGVRSSTMFMNGLTGSSSDPLSRKSDRTMQPRQLPAAKWCTARARARPAGMRRKAASSGLPSCRAFLARSSRPVSKSMLSRAQMVETPQNGLSCSERAANSDGVETLH